MHRIQCHQQEPETQVCNCSPESRINTRAGDDTPILMQMIATGANLQVLHEQSLGRFELRKARFEVAQLPVEERKQ